MDTMNTRDEAQTGARIALRNGAEGSASEADIEDAARIAVDIKELFGGPWPDRQWDRDRLARRSPDEVDAADKWTCGRIR